MKDAFRVMIAEDPDADGKAFEALDSADFNRRIAKIEEGDQLALNETFLSKMIEGYRAKFESFNPGIIERKYSDKVIDFLFAAYRNDSAYYERIGGIVAWLVVHKNDFAKENGDHTAVLEALYDFWKTNDKRQRTIPWIDWGFRYIIKKYKKSKKFGFYRMSVNYALNFIYLNAQNWQHDEIFYPENWFGNTKGAQLVDLYAGHF